MSSSRDSYHHGRLADALEEAAFQLLERMPAAEISLREVARAADVSHNAPYHHFRDRRGLLTVLAERSMAGLNREVEAAINADEPAAGAAGASGATGAAGAAGTMDAAARLRAGAAAYIRFAVAHSHAFNVIYDPLVCIPTQPTKTMAPLIERLEQVLGETAGRAGFGDEAEVRALWGLVHGLGTLCAAGHFSEADAHAACDAAITRMLAGERAGQESALGSEATTGPAPAPGPDASASAGS
ncbi:TetR/AcrR family transcriptional regulator [Leucobacter luti]|nr:TetR/AcrR family transcriptional regulator [Leucobacter luti]